MSKQNIAVLTLVMAFCFLWVPLGQHEFLFAHWMKVGAFMAPFLLLVAFASNGLSDTSFYRDLRLISVVMLAAYILHQFEEHWIDLTGTTYAFYIYVNELLGKAVGAPENAELLSPAGIFVINTSLVWLVGAIAILLSPRKIFPFLCMAAIIIVNAVSHIAAGIATMSYNPGLATSILVFLPAGLWALRSAQSGRLWVIVASFVWAILAHVVMIGGTIGAKWGLLFAEEAYFAMLVVMSLLPAVLFRSEPTP